MVDCSDITVILNTVTPGMFLSIAVLVRLLLTALALVLGLMALSAWNRRRLAPEAPVFALLILCAAVYCFGYAGEVVQSSLAGAMFWLHVEYFGIPWIPALWLLGARNHYGLRSRYSLVFAVPIVTFIGELTTPLHKLYDTSLSLIPRDPFWVVEAHHGPIAWLNSVYLYCVFLYGAWLYLFKPSAQERDKVQAWTLVAASLIPLAGNLVYLLGWSPWGLDLAPMTLGASAILGYIVMFRLGCFDLVPMAHSLVFGSMRDAALVTDLRHRLVDFNAAAAELFPSLAAAKPGDDPAQVLRENPTLANILLGNAGNQRLTFEIAGEKRHFDVRVFPLCRNKRKAGWAAILAEITAHVRMVHELQEKADTDALTGVANRHYFLSAIEREYARAARRREPFSVAIVDVDQFKAINDNMGHHAGDTVLLAVAGRILRSLRASDLLSRYGGDEFVALLPETSKEGAWEVAERMRVAVAGNPVNVDQQVVHTTISIGLATQEPADRTGWEELLKRADKALYKAKRQGRNRVAAWRV